METSIEYVEFKLAEGATEAEMLRGFEGTNEWLKQQPGFFYRSIAEDKQRDLWVDVVYWASKEAAEQAGKLFMESPDCKAFMQTIDVQSVQMNHYAVKGELMSDNCSA